MKDKYAVLEIIGYVVAGLAAVVLALVYWGTSLANPDMTSMRVLIQNRHVFFWGTIIIFAGAICIRVGDDKKGRNRG